MWSLFYWFRNTLDWIYFIEFILIQKPMPEFLKNHQRQQFLFLYFQILKLKYWPNVHFLSKIIFDYILLVNNCSTIYFKIYTNAAETTFKTLSTLPLFKRLQKKGDGSQFHAYAFFFLMHVQRLHRNYATTRPIHGIIFIEKGYTQIRII